MNDTHRKLSWRRKLLWGLLVSFVLLSIPEMVLRLFLFEVPIPKPPTVCAWPAADSEMEDLGHFLQPDRYCFYDLRPGAHYSYFGTPMDRINRQGFRGPEVEREHHRAVRIACFGDSSTFGMCVSEPLTWARQLEGLLREQHVGSNIELINAGVIGYTVFQGLQKYEFKVRAFRPTMAVLAFGAINEQMPALGASDLERAAAWSRDYSRHLRGSADLVWKLRTVQWAGQGLLESRAKARSALIAECMSSQTAFEGQRPYPPRMSYEEFEQYLMKFVDVLEADGCVPILVNPPRRASTEQRYPQVRPLSEIILSVAESKGVALFDANQLVKENPDHEMEYFADTHHPNAKGNRIIAEGLCEFLAPYMRH